MEQGKRNTIFLTLSIIIFLAGIAALAVGLFLTFKSTGDKLDEEYVFPMWGYRCEENLCQKYKLTSENNKTADGLALCRLHCSEKNTGTLWPLPSGDIQVSKDVLQINPKNITFKTNKFKNDKEIWLEVEERFREIVMKKAPKSFANEAGSEIAIEVIVSSENMKLTYDTKEGYKLKIVKDSNQVQIVIEADNFYGARHGLETLSQLIIYDEIKDEIMIVGDSEIMDEPRFKHRGLSLDTSRNFFPVDVLKRNINGMAMVKLNTLHWHMSDSQNFPLLLKKHPDLAMWSAYSMDKIYTPDDVIEIVRYAKARGIRVVPEADVPGHISEGFFRKNLTSCYSYTTTDQCRGARPCGQLDPTKDEVYEVLEDIYGEQLEYFDYPGLFHMGGDEVWFPCWNASESLKAWMAQKEWNLDDDGFMNLWEHFQENAVAALDKVDNRKVPVIVWSSSLTEEPYLTRHLDKDRYIIQYWTEKDDSLLEPLLQNGYKLIVSNADSLYLDCGFGSWVRNGNNWCTPYKGWQKVYDNRMEDIGGEYIDQIMGAEATLFAEQVDEWTLDSRLWPRLSALAERLWTNPETTFREAESRMLLHRSQLVQVGGLGAEKLQPEWCLQNEGVCPLPML